MAHIDPTRPVDDGGNLSPAPGTPQSATKAIIGGLVTVVLAVLVALVGFVTGDETLSDVTAAEWLAVSIAALGSGAFNGLTIYNTRNHPKV